MVLVLLGVPSFSDLFRAGCKTLPPADGNPANGKAFQYCSLSCYPTMQSLVDISSDAGWLDTALAAMTLVQSLMQVRQRLRCGLCGGFLALQAQAQLVQSA